MLPYKFVIMRSFWAHKWNWDCQDLYFVDLRIFSMMESHVTQIENFIEVELGKVEFNVEIRH